MANRSNKKMKRVPQQNKPVPARTDPALPTAIRLQVDGRLAEAQAIYDKILRANPRDFIALNNSGLIASSNGRDDEAEQLFRKSVAINPRYLMPHMNLGNIFWSRKMFPEALAHYQRAAEIDPKYPAIHVNLGNLFRDHGKFEEAIASYNRALALKPDMAEAHLNLGNAFVQLNRVPEAIRQYERALSYQPRNAEALNCMGVALLKLGDIDRSRISLEQSLLVAPGNVDALLNLGTVFTALGQTNESVRCCQRILDLHPENANAQSNLLSSLNYCDSLTPEAIAQQSRRIGELIEGRFLADRPPHRNDADPNRRLRIGYVSGDFRTHAVAFFLQPLLCHDRGAVEIFCYAEVAAPDRITERFRAFADHWFSTVGVSDDALAARIRDDGIDILIDLAGHTEANRLAVFARRPAPVQMTWIGYPNTTGLKSIDYRLVDAITDPPGVADRLASETLLRLDDCFLCYTPAEIDTSADASPMHRQRRDHLRLVQQPGEAFRRFIPPMGPAARPRADRPVAAQEPLFRRGGVPVPRPGAPERARHCVRTGDPAWAQCGGGGSAQRLSSGRYRAQFVSLQRHNHDV